MNVAIKDIDGYITAQDENVQPGLYKLREIIKATAPDAEEVISYGMPAFKYHGKLLVGFAAAKKHFGFYPCNSTTVEQFKEDLQTFETSKGAIRFPLEKALPVSLIKKIVKSRMKENLSLAKK